LFIEYLTMHILHLSDTHNQHRQLGKLPAADVIIHSGDISYAGTGKEVVDFIDWFGALDYKYKIFIAGNHDYCLEEKGSEILKRYLTKNCYYLYNSGVTIENINFWGMPFFFSPEEENSSYSKTIDLIPEDTDILITHRPPLGVLDNANNISYGCPDLLLKVLDIRPSYHLFGHVHDAYGIEKSNHTIFANAAIVDENYFLLNDPFVFEI